MTTSSSLLSGAPARIVKSVVLIAAVLLSQSVLGDDWSWSVTPYAWIIDTRFETAVKAPDDGDEESLFGDFSETLDFAAQLHLEGSGERFGALLDITNLQQSDRAVLGEIQFKYDSNVTLVEAGVTYKVDAGSEAELLVIGGVRALNVNYDLIGAAAGSSSEDLKFSIDETLADAMAGLRYSRRLGERWGMALRGDVATGDTDYTVNIALGLTRDIGGAGSLIVGYRYLYAALDDSGPIQDPSLRVAGPLLGFRIAL